MFYCQVPDVYTFHAKQANQFYTTDNVDTIWLDM